MKLCETYSIQSSLTPCPVGMTSSNIARLAWHAECHQKGRPRVGWCDDDVAILCADSTVRATCRGSHWPSLPPVGSGWLKKLFVTQGSGMAQVPHGPHPVTALLPLACWHIGHCRALATLPNIGTEKDKADTHKHKNRHTPTEFCFSKWLRGRYFSPHYCACVCVCVCVFVCNGGSTSCRICCV